MHIKTVQPNSSLKEALPWIIYFLVILLQESGSPNLPHAVNVKEYVLAGSKTDNMNNNNRDAVQKQHTVHTLIDGASACRDFIMSHGCSPLQLSLYPAVEWGSNDVIGPYSLMDIRMPLRGTWSMGRQTSCEGKRMFTTQHNISAGTVGVEKYRQSSGTGREDNSCYAQAVFPGILLHADGCNR